MSLPLLPSSLLLALLAVAPLSPQQQTIQTHEPVVAVERPPQHPTLPAGGPRRSAVGVIRHVACSFPSVIEFRLVGAAGALALYNNHFPQIDLSVLNFDPKGSMDPCHQFEGMKARVEYLPSAEKGIAGQVVAVELRK